MAIDFSRFTQSITAIVPVFEQSFSYRKKQYSIDCTDGWWEVELSGNTAKALSLQYMPSIEHTAKGFTFNNFLIFNNMDVAKRLYGLPPQVPLRLNSSGTFAAVLVYVWEDGCVYFVGPDYSDVSVYAVKNLYEQEKTLETVKGITPELRILYLNHTLGRNALQKKISAQDFGGRLKTLFANAGAALLEYSTSDVWVEAKWTLAGGGYTYNSVLHKETLAVRELGYCASGDDKRHNITSMVLTAKDYEDEGLTYITRY